VPSAAIYCCWFYGELTSNALENALDLTEWAAE